MVHAGYNPNGFIGLMDLLMNLSKHKPSAIELMFSTHPMSVERHQTAINAVRSKYSANNQKPIYRERFMDHTAGLRKIKGAIEKMQQGERLMGEKKYQDSESSFRDALKEAPEDYAGLMMLSKCLYVQEKYSDSEHYSEKAKDVYPQEAQSYHMSGMTQLMQKKYETALQRFASYDEKLPGNPNTNFFKGYSFEGMEKIQDAANEYTRYLKAVNQGEQADYAYQRLEEWGYINNQSNSQK